MNWSRQIGIFLVILSFLFYGSILLIPILPLHTTQKVAVAPILALIGELAFWIGGVLLGKEVVSRYRSFFNPRNWFSKHQEDKSNDS